MNCFTCTGGVNNDSYIQEGVHYWHSRRCGLPLCGCFFGCCCAFDGNNSNGNTMVWAHQKIIFQALSDDVILFAAPIFATVPFSGAFVEDVKSGYTKQVLPRTTVKDYVIRNEMTCAVSGFLTIVFGLLIGAAIITLAITPIETFSSVPVESVFVKIIGRIGLYGLAGALWAMVGMLCSTITMNSYMAYASPFILYYVLIILQERYARDYFMLNPQNYLTLEGKWPFGGWSAAITMLVLLIAVMLGFQLNLL